MKKVFIYVLILFVAPVLLSSFNTGVRDDQKNVSSLKFNWGSSAYAASSCKKKERRRVPPIREKTFKVLQEAQLLIDPEKAPRENPDDPPPNIKADPVTALKILKVAKGRKGLNGYEISQISNMMAYAFYTLNDTPNTIKAYKDVLKSEISLALELSTLRTLFQLYLIAEDLDTALSYLGKWEKVNCDPDPGMIYFKAYIYLQKGDTNRAMRYALEVEKVAIELERKIKEDWWYLQVILYNQKKDYDNVIKVLEKLIVNYPKKRYWVHLSGMYGEKGRDDAALSTAYAAYTQDMFDRETEIIVLVQRLLNAEVPFEAAMVMDRGIKQGIVKKSEKTLKLLAQAYTMSKEMGKAIDTWRKATKFGEDGQLYYRLAQALSNEDRHKEAVKAYKDALKKGDLDKPSDVRFWLGISLLQIQDWDNAIKAFRETARVDKAQEKRCKQYIAYIESEKRRLKAIKELLES